MSNANWRGIVDAEQEFNVPIIHPVAAGVWSILKHLRVRHPIRGFGRLLEQFP